MYTVFLLYGAFNPFPAIFLYTRTQGAVYASPVRYVRNNMPMIRATGPSIAYMTRVDPPMGLTRPQMALGGQASANEASPALLRTRLYGSDESTSNFELTGLAARRERRLRARKCMVDFVPTHSGTLWARLWRPVPPPASLLAVALGTRWSTHREWSHAKDVRSDPREVVRSLIIDTRVVCEALARHGIVSVSPDSLACSS